MGFRCNLSRRTEPKRARAPRLEKADELATYGAEGDGGAMAAAQALTIKQLRKDIYASIEYAADIRPSEGMERQG